MQLYLSLYSYLQTTTFAYCQKPSPYCPTHHLASPMGESEVNWHVIGHPHKVASWEETNTQSLFTPVFYPNSRPKELWLWMTTHTQTHTRIHTPELKPFSGIQNQPCLTHSCQTLLNSNNWAMALFKMSTPRMYSITKSPWSGCEATLERELLNPFSFSLWWFVFVLFMYISQKETERAEMIYNRTGSVQYGHKHKSVLLLHAATRVTIPTGKLLKTFYLLRENNY